MLHQCPRLAFHLRRVRAVQATVLHHLPRFGCRSIRKPFALTLCCTLVGATACKYTDYIQISIPKVVCQAAVISENTDYIPIQTVKSFTTTVTERLKVWHFILRTFVSNIVQFVHIALRVIRNSILFGPILLSYPLVLLFPTKFQDVWLSALLRAVELSGPTFIKLGQWSSTRRDLFSQDFCDHLSKLHRNAPSHSLEYTERALEHAFGMMWRDVFRLESPDSTELLSTSAVYSGCVGQVHKAYMKSDVYQAVMEGRQYGPRQQWGDSESCDQEWILVAIKVLHPGILESVHLDLRIIHLFARCLCIIPGLHWISPVELVSEFETLMKKQIYLKKEAENLERFHQNFTKVPYVRVPQPIWPFVTDQVLVETYETGQSISSLITSDPHTSNDVKKHLAQLGVDVILKMVFVDNFVHADLHPGNILVQGLEESLSQPKRVVYVEDWIDEFQVTLRDAPNPLRLVLLDTGITAHLDKQDFKNFYDVFTAIVLCKGDVVAELFVEHSSSNECKDLGKFKSDMSYLVKKAHEQTLQLGMIQVGQLMRDLFSLLIHHKVKLESNFASVILAIMVLEGMGRSLDPDLDILQAAKPVLLGN